MKISYVTTYNVSDVNRWSGTGFNIAKMLGNSGFDIEYIGKLKTNNYLKAKVKQNIYRKILRKNFDTIREPYIAKGYAEQVIKRISKDTDVIFSPGTVPVALLDTNKPKVIYTDATFAGMINFYESFSNFCNQTVKQGNYLEQKALESAEFVIFSSEWAKQTAIDNYNIDASKIKVVPFGSNFHSNFTSDEIKRLIQNRSQKECHLLFLGVDWKRKGGDIALKVTEMLNAHGLKTTLHVAGIKKLPIKHIPNCVVNYGFISKKEKKGIELLENLMTKSHFLILPTIADCTPIVYSEANSFGLPCITTNVGGIPTIIKSGVNGQIFSLNENAQKYAEYINDIFHERSRYINLCCSAYNEYGTRLNWDTTGNEITKLLCSI